jgi:hypothetical protein
MQKISAFFALVLFFSAFALSAKADCGDPDPSKPKHPKSIDALPACSYTTSNNSCKVAIDRINPSTPPTIYVRPACSVYVVVQNVYPLERLTLDWKSSTIVIPTDTFQRAFTALSPNLGAITVLGGGPHLLALCEKTPTGCTTAQTISEAQKRLAKDAAIQPYTTVKPQIAEIKRALLPPPGGTDHPGQPWEQTAEWQATTYAALKAEIDLIQSIKDIQAKLTANIATLQASASTAADKADVDLLLKNQKVLDENIKLLDVPAAKIKALADGLNSLAIASNGIEGNAVKRACCECAAGSLWFVKTSRPVRAFLRVLCQPTDS